MSEDDRYFPPGLNFDELSHILWQQGIETHASEANGICYGLLCSGQVVALAPLATALICGDPQGDRVLQEQLADESEKLRLLLQAGQLQFQLVLPDDDMPITEQVEALGAWCKGFVLAFEQYRDSGHNWSDNSQELWQDIREIADIETNDEEDEGECREKNFMEVMEFIRVAIQYLFDEADSINATTDPAAIH
jgi:hypothetical protein